MRTKFSGRVLGALVSVAVVSTALQATPVFAQQQNCTCVLPASTGTVGMISKPVGSVLVTSRSGQVQATEGSALQYNAVVKTSESGSADIDLGKTTAGQNCAFAMSSSMQMQIVPQAGNTGGLCVQVIDTTAALTPSLDGTTMAVVAGLGAGVGLLALTFSLGQESPVSQ